MQNNLFVSVDIEGTVEQPRQIGICVCDICNADLDSIDLFDNSKTFVTEIDFRIKYDSNSIFTLSRPSTSIIKQCIELCEQIQNLEQLPWIYWGGPERVVMEKIYALANMKCKIKFMDLHKPWRNFLKFRLNNIRISDGTPPKKPNGNIRSSLKSAIAFINSMEYYNQTHDALRDAKDNMFVMAYLLRREKIIEMVRNCPVSIVPAIRRAAMSFYDCEQNDVTKENGICRLFMAYFSVRVTMYIRRTVRLTKRNFPILSKAYRKRIVDMTKQPLT